MKKVFLTWMAFFVAIIAADAQQTDENGSGSRGSDFSDSVKIEKEGKTLAKPSEREEKLNYK